MTVPYSAVLHDASMPPRREDRERMGYTPEQMARLEARDVEFAEEDAVRNTDAVIASHALRLADDRLTEIQRLRDQNAALRVEVVRLTAALDDAVRPEDRNAI